MRERCVDGLSLARPSIQAHAQYIIVVRAARMLRRPTTPSAASQLPRANGRSAMQHDNNRVLHHNYSIISGSQMERTDKYFTKNSMSPRG